MLRRSLPVVAFALVLVLWVHAQEPKGDTGKDKKEAPKPLKAPEGWKYVRSQDKSHAFLIPRNTQGEERSEGTFKAAGFAGKTATFVAHLPDGRTFVVVQTNLSGPATKDMKINDVYDLIYDADKSEKGTKISEPKEIQVGVRKGREYFVTEKGTVRRVVTVVVRGRVIQLAVEAEKRAQLMDKNCDTFLTSLVLYSTTPAKAGAKKDDAKKDVGKDK
jgi:hypothetical protein